MIIDRKTLGAGTPMTTVLTAAQEKKIYDLYTEGFGPQEIKHKIYKDFEGGKPFHHLLDSAVNKIETVQKICDEAMAGDKKPTTVTALKAEVKKKIEGAAAVVDYATSKVVGKTGTFKEYEGTFKTVAVIKDVKEVG